MEQQFVFPHKVAMEQKVYKMRTVPGKQFVGIFFYLNSEYYDSIFV